MSESDSPLPLTLHNAFKDRTQRAVIQQMLSEMLITIEDKVFIGKSFCLDGYRFINCRFESCTLSTYRGTFELHQCSLDDSTKRLFGQDAQKCVQYYSFKNPALKCSAPFGPKIYPDGSVSIGAASMA